MSYSDMLLLITICSDNGFTIAPAPLSTVADLSL